MIGIYKPSSGDTDPDLCRIRVSGKPGVFSQCPNRSVYLMWVGDEAYGVCRQHHNAPKARSQAEASLRDSAAARCAALGVGDANLGPGYEYFNTAGRISLTIDEADELLARLRLADEQGDEMPRKVNVEDAP